MADRKLKIDIRREKILEQLRRDGKISVSELSSSLGATVVTIRNDLNTLEQEGYLTRIQGGAVLADRRKAARVTEQIANGLQKRAIGSAVAAMIRDGDTLFINSGTTSLCVAEALRDRKNLNIVTNALAVAVKLKEISTFRVILLGGVINAQYGFTYGSDVQEQLSRYLADWAILSVDGISAGGGITTYHAEEATTDRMMMDNARNILIVADSTKVGRPGFSWIRDCGGDVHLVTDDGGQAAGLEALRHKGVQVTVVDA